MSKFPISHWVDHITFDDKLGPCAVYNVPMHNYTMVSADERLSIFSVMSNAYQTMGRDFKILSFCREVIPNDYGKVMHNLKEIKGIFETEYQDHINSSTSQLSKLKSWHRELFLIIPIKKAGLFDKMRKEGMKESLRDARDVVTEMFLGKDPTISQSALEKAFEDEEDISHFVESILHGRRATSVELQWILNRISTRSIAPRPVIENWTPSSVISTKGTSNTTIQPIKNTIMTTHYNYEIDSTKSDYLVITHPDTKEQSYQSFVSFADYPEDVYGLGNETFFFLDQLGYPIDFAVEVEHWTADDSSKKLYGKNLEMIEQSKQYSESITGSPLELQDAHGRSKLLEDKLNSKMPLLNVTTVLAISSTNETHLRQIRKEVLNKVKGYYAVVAPGKQRESYMQFMPVMTYGLNVYRIPMDPQFLASMMVNATTEIGEKVGFYLGVVINGSRPPLLINPPLAQKENKTATTAILGNLGGGKSVLNKTLIYYLLMWGAKVIAIDPKNENFCFQLIPAVNARMKQIDIGSDEASINPYKIAIKDIDTTAVVVDFLSIILNANESGDASENRRIAIQRAVSMTMEQKVRNMEITIRAFHYIYSNPKCTLPQKIKDQAETCYILLNDYKKMAISNTVFTEGDGTLDINKLDDQFVNFNISQLPLPTEQDMQNLGQTNKLPPLKLLGSSIMYLIVQFARYATLNASKRLYKVLSLDEGWKLSSSPQGADLIMEIIRMGRTYNIMPIIATQSAGDLLGEKVRNNIGMVFMFKNKDEDEIRSCAKLLGMREASRDFIDDVRAMKSGTCYFRDLNDRVSKIMIRPNPEHLIKIFDTKPESAADLEEAMGR
ncbi:AAA-like domain protein [compost metagenome]